MLVTAGKIVQLLRASVGPVRFSKEHDGISPMLYGIPDESGVAMVICTVFVVRWTHVSAKKTSAL
jgi:hypothetical protein